MWVNKNKTKQTKQNAKPMRFRQIAWGGKRKGKPIAVDQLASILQVFVHIWQYWSSIGEVMERKWKWNWFYFPKLSEVFGLDSFWHAPSKFLDTICLFATLFQVGNFELTLSIDWIEFLQTKKWRASFLRIHCFKLQISSITKLKHWNWCQLQL